LVVNSKKKKIILINCITLSLCYILNWSRLSDI
jgi:hypothetical protein